MLNLGRQWIAVVLMVVTVWSGACRHDDSSNDELVDYVWAYSQTHPDGFTLDILKKAPVTSGIAVSYYATQNSFGKASLNWVIEHALWHDGIVGGWLNTEDSLYYFDSSRLFPDGAYQEAMAFAIENQQQAFYDITHDSTIWVNLPQSFILYFIPSPLSDSGVVRSSYRPHGPMMQPSPPADRARPVLSPLEYQ
ncbi:MAG: hypothetical protein KBA26_10355 [Candidatus Delongbacteria bacterium]|nr:hypothetical protein [Candidatus Delongbacteria bacterium]